MAESAQCSITRIMNQILACVHRQNTDPGLVGRALAARGMRLDLRCAVFGDVLPSLHDYQGLVIFGGPQSANDETADLLAEYQLVEQALKQNKPLLGICLGAQMIARVFGGTVQENNQGQVEAGFYKISAHQNSHGENSHGEKLFSPSLMVYQWHREGIRLPQNDQSISMLAVGSEFFPVQAFWNRRRAYGLQFHPEVNFRTIRRWLARDKDEDSRLQHPGARPYWSHLAEYMLHHRAMTSWLDKFFHIWLAPEGGRP